MKDYILKVTMHRSFKVTVKGVDNFDEAWQRCKHWLLTQDGNIINEPYGINFNIEMEESGNAGDITVVPFISGLEK